MPPGGCGEKGSRVRRGQAADGPVVAVRVPAKINLFLAVRGVRDDGYHELVSVMQTVSLYDRLRVGVVGPPGRGHHPAGRRRMRLDLWYEPALGLPPPEDNLALRAARALGSWTGSFDLAPDMEPPGAAADATAGHEPAGDEAGAGDAGPDLNGLAVPRLRGTRGPRTVIDLDKRIPVAGGMAGGSADAAGALVALNTLWGCDLLTDELRQVAASVGSDVPFCLIGGTALATGRGTALAQVLCRGTFHWVIGESDEPLATSEVYRAWDERCRPSEIEPDAVLAALRGGDAVALGAALHNDLEPAAMALRPELAERKAALLDAGALGAVLSGSGPTMVALAADAVGARALSDAVRPMFTTVSVARSPAGGPELDA